MSTNLLGPATASSAAAPVGDLAEEWVTSRLARGEILAATAKNHRSHLRLLGGYAVLDAVAVESYVRATAHLAASTRRLRYSTVAAFLVWAHEVGAAGTDLGPLLPTVRVPRAVPRALPPSVSARVVAACGDARSRLVVVLGLQLGLRCCEIASLRLDDLSAGLESVRVTGKSHHSRVLPLTVEARAALEAYLAERPKSATRALVVSHRNVNERVSAGVMGRIVTDAMWTAGVKVTCRDGVSAHALRHSFATDLVQAGVDLPTIQRALGHASIRTTGRYVAADAESLRPAMEGRTYTPSQQDTS